MTTEKGENDPCNPRQLGLPARHNIETIFKNNIAKSESTKKKGVYAGKSEGLFPVFRPKKLEEKKKQHLPTEWIQKKRRVAAAASRVRYDNAVYFDRNAVALTLCH